MFGRSGIYRNLQKTLAVNFRRRRFTFLTSCLLAVGLLLALFGGIELSKRVVSQLPRGRDVEPSVAAPTTAAVDNSSPKISNDVESEAKRRVAQRVAAQQRAANDKLESDKRNAFEKAVEDRINNDIELQSQLHPPERAVEPLRTYVTSKSTELQSLRRMPMLDQFIKANMQSDKFRWMAVHLDILNDHITAGIAQAAVIEDAYGDDPQFQAILSAN